MLFQFASERELELTRQKGSFSMFGIPLILQPVLEHFRLDMEPNINIPVWIQLKDLEPYFWHEEAIGKIASKIGIPIWAYFRSIHKSSLNWSRVQVIIDASKAPKKLVKLRSHKWEMFNQEIEYEFLQTCKVFGHYSEGCKGPEERNKQFQPANFGRFRSRSRGLPVANVRQISRSRGAHGSMPPRRHPSKAPLNHAQRKEQTNVYRPVVKPQMNADPSILGLPSTSNRFEIIDCEEEEQPSLGTTISPYKQALMNDMVAAN